MKNRFKEYDVCLIKHPLPGFGVPTGAMGTVLIVFDTVPPSYEVEFCDDSGAMLALVSLNEDELDVAPLDANRIKRSR